MPWIPPVSAPHRLRWRDRDLELHLRRSAMRTEVVLLGDGEELARAAGFDEVLLRWPQDAGDGEPEAAILVRLGWSGRIRRAHLAVAGPGSPAGGAPGSVAAAARLPEAAARLAGVEQHRFEPPPGSSAARVLAFQRRHPRLFASRHVIRAAATMLFGLLGLAVLVRQLLQPLVRWLRERLPDLRLPALAWPDLPAIPWPDVPWPDLDLPDVEAPPWLLAVLATLKVLGPVLLATGLAVAEVRRRRTPRPPTPAPPPPQTQTPTQTPEDCTPDAHRGPPEAPAAADAHRRGGRGTVRREGAGRHLDR